MRKPTNEPSCKLMRKPTNYQTTNEVQPSYTSNTSYKFEAVSGINTSDTFEAVNDVNAKPFEAVNGMSHVHVKDIVNNRAGVSQPTVAKTSDGDEVNDMINAHNKHIVTGGVMFSDGRDSEIQSMCLDESKPRPNKWQMTDKINLDSEFQENQQKFDTRMPGSLFFFWCHQRGIAMWSSSSSGSCNKFFKASWRQGIHSILWAMTQ
jgi:hypothetical protein